MVERWWQEAERNQVLPLDNRPFSELVFARPPAVPPRERYTYWPGRAPVPEAVAVNVRGRPHAVTAHVTIEPGLGVVEGVLLVQGSVLGGWSFHLLADGRLCYVHNLAGWRHYRVEAPIGVLPPGDHELGFRFTPPALELVVDGAVVGAGEVKRTAWSRFSLTGAGLTAGWSPDLSPAADDYRGRFAFTGTLHRVDVDVSGLPALDPTAEAADAISSQ
jgi:arylsulfatase